MVSTATMVDALLVEVGTVEAVVIATMLDALLGEVGTVEAVVIATMLDALLENVGTVVEVVIATMLDADLEAVDMVVAAAVESHLRWRHQRVESYRVVVEFWASLKPSSQDSSEDKQIRRGLCPGQRMWICTSAKFCGPPRRSSRKES
jgi:hypothetical protein